MFIVQHFGACCSSNGICLRDVWKFGNDGLGSRKNGENNGDVGDSGVVAGVGPSGLLGKELGKSGKLSMPSRDLRIFNNFKIGSRRCDTRIVART